MTTANAMPSDPEDALVTVPAEVSTIATEQLGAYFEGVSGIDRSALIRDFLDWSKSQRRADILQRHVALGGKKVLEIGSGFGTNLAYWIKRYHIDGYGVEPGGTGFDSTFHGSRLVFRANDLDPYRIANAGGEALPFDDGAFDIAYSANVLEHTTNPEQVIRESLRVLRRGGILHMEMPNFLSYFEGHYMIVQPPICWTWVLPAWVRLCGRDPAFARTLNTRINPRWCRRVVRDLKDDYDVTLLSLGTDIFLERLSQEFAFETQVVASRLSRVIAAIRVLNVGNWVGHCIVALQGHYPIYLTLRKD